MSPSTKGALEARLLDVGEAKPEDFAKLGAAIKGAIVLVHSAEMKTFDDLFAEYFRNTHAARIGTQIPARGDAARIHTTARFAVPASHLTRYGRTLPCRRP